jgi:site-specific DNA-methyltransferase (adenine-specific)
MTRLNQVLSGDCIEVMATKIPKQSVDLIYADPPYNLSGRALNLINNTTGGAFFKMNEAWDTWDYSAYTKFTDQWIQGAWSVLKNNGSLYVSCTYHNIAEVILAAKKTGFKTNNILTWHKTNAMPSITKRVFTHATEYVCWFVKGKNWIYNYAEMKKMNPQRAKDGSVRQMRDFIGLVELPVVQGKERLRAEDGRAFHPTQKPEKLLEIIISASSNPGDTVLDPFFGTGTTGAVARRLGRNWLGIEKEGKYRGRAIKRVKEAHLV